MKPRKLVNELVIVTEMESDFSRGVRIERTTCPIFIRIILLLTREKDHLSKEATHFLLRIRFKFVILASWTSKLLGKLSGKTFDTNLKRFPKKKFNVNVQACSERLIP